MLELRCLFQGQYHAKYQRNNKRCGFKNLRCFPQCGPNGEHHDKGFCGAPIMMDLSLTTTNTKIYNPSTLRAWGEFALQEAEPRLPVGCVFTLDDIAPLLRSEVSRSNPFFESVVDHSFCELDQEKTRFAFHSQKMGYHYGWVGNKHSSNQCHVFCTYVATEISPNKFQCIGVFRSPAFTIYCRRRHKTVSKEEKDQLAEPSIEHVVKHYVNESGMINETTLPPIRLPEIKKRRRPSTITTDVRPTRAVKRARSASISSASSSSYSSMEDDEDESPEVIDTVSSVYEMLNTLSRYQKSSLLSLDWLLLPPPKKEEEDDDTKPAETDDENESNDDVVAKPEGDVPRDVLDKCRSELQELLAMDISPTLNPGSFNSFVEVLYYRLRKMEPILLNKRMKPLASHDAEERLKKAFLQLVSSSQDMKQGATVVPLLVSSSCLTSPSSSCVDGENVCLSDDDIKLLEQADDDPESFPLAELAMDFFVPDSVSNVHHHPIDVDLTSVDFIRTFDEDWSKA